MSDPPPRIGATARSSEMAIEPVVGFRFGPALEIGAPSNGSGVPADPLASIGDLTWTLLACSSFESPAWLAPGNDLPWDTAVRGDTGLLNTAGLDPSLSFTGESAGLLDPAQPSNGTPEAPPKRSTHALQQTSDKESARLPASVAPLRNSPIPGTDVEAQSAAASFVQQAQQEFPQPDLPQRDLPPSFIEDANANQVGTEAAASAPTSVSHSDPTRSEHPAREEHLHEATLSTPAEPEPRPSEPLGRGAEANAGQPDLGGGRSSLSESEQPTSTDGPQTNDAFLHNVPAPVEVGADNAVAASSAETSQADSVRRRPDLQPWLSASAAARNSSSRPVPRPDTNATETASGEGQAAEAGAGAAGVRPSASGTPTAFVKKSELRRETTADAHSEVEVSHRDAGPRPPTGTITEPLRSQPERAVTPIVGASAKPADQTLSAALFGEVGYGSSDGTSERTTDEPAIVPPMPNSGGPRSSARTAVPEPAAADQDAPVSVSLDRPAAPIVAEGRAPTRSNSGDLAPTGDTSPAAPAIEPVVSSTHRTDALPGATASPQRQAGGTAKGSDVAQAPPAGPREAKPRHTVSHSEQPAEPPTPEPTIAGSAQSPDTRLPRPNRSNAAARSNPPRPRATSKAVTAPAIGATSAPVSSQEAAASPTRTRQEQRRPVAFSFGPPDTGTTPPVIPPRVTIASAENTGEAPNAFNARAPQIAAETPTSAKMTGSTAVASAGSIVIPSAAQSVPSAARRREQGEAAPIRISIGRVDVDSPPLPAEPTRPGRARPKMSLNEYLKRRRDVP